ncbi:MAG: hypothetical protein IKK59_00375 [Lachnospiraceae bacterium]|nr:hypothetical protein [Lachnospiraceae bacterium]
MNKNKKLWIGVISLALALMLFAVLLIVQKSMQEEPVYQKVLCANTTIPQSTKITAENIDTYIKQQDIPVDWLPKDYVSASEKVLDMVVEADVSEGSVITGSVLKAYQEYYEEYQKLTLISVPVGELYQGVAGSLRMGDYVDIYTLYEEEKEYHCQLLAEHIRIAATYSDQGQAIGTDNAEGLSQLIIIPMEREQVALFYESLARGHIRIAKYEAV